MFFLLSFGNSKADDQIELHGSLSNGQLRPSFIPFEVTQSANLITIAYQSTLSNIGIQITDELGVTVYSNNVNPVSGQQLSISITGWEAGSYEITISNSSGGFISGEFNIQN
jgi:hypothetical protein